ncbi:MAG: sodium:solute symporter [Cyclobacteriaceae bacterium]
MNWLDYLVVVVYIVGFLFLGYFFKQNSSKTEYFLGGKSFGWFPLGLSVMATQLSAISFVSAPAFVGLREGGGMQWLSFEFGVPLAMIFLGLYLVPRLYRSGVVSIYEYLERRFNRSTRILISIVFQVSRSFSTGIMIYAVALILMSILDVPLWQTILVIGVITVIYSYQGGMKAVVYGDMIQMIVLLVGIFICAFAGLSLVGGWSSFIADLDPNRLNAVDFSVIGVGGDGDFGVLPMVLGGFFLYASYYGTDQSQVQRLLSAKSMKTVKQTLLFNGLMRFPITFLYCIMGLIIGTLALKTPEFISQIPSDKVDLMIPIFIRDYLPHGIIGLLIVAILSAAMSSLSSAVNSLSAVTTEDILVGNRKVDDKTYVKYSKLAALFWGGVCIILAFFGGDIASTVIEAINKIGSVFYGPILATFLIAVSFRTIGAKAMNVGLLLGVATNIYLWLVVGDNLFWFWWNFIGAIISFTVAFVISKFGNAESDLTSDDEPDEIDWRFTGLLLGGFVAILLISIWITQSA